MEDMARLAVMEQTIGDPEKFTKVLYELLNLLTYILENSHDYTLRNINCDRLKKHLETDAFEEYLKYVGFEKVNNQLRYPKDKTLSKLKTAHAALERKINICCDTLSTNTVNIIPAHSSNQVKISKFTPSNVLRTRNVLLLKIEALFNNMIKYEDEALQQLARSHIPLPTLQLKAIDRIREHQAKIKAGESKMPDLPFDIALLMELMGWFKHSFFKWADKPDCERCGSSSRFVQSATHSTNTEICTVEVYQCLQCHQRLYFPRYNDPRTLLNTRRGRCGEWANCFTLMCRALSYDTRYVYDTTDHVWCEVYDYDSKTWLHVDPCEAKLNAPLLYSHGWGKKLSYVIAVSRDDVQDVTWRYTTDHKEVLKRRQMCAESELTSTILLLRERRQRQVSEARRRYLARRTVEELAQLLVERKPSDFESHGRISGSKEWRAQRGEAGSAAGFTFNFNTAGNYIIGYFPAADEYRVTGNFEPQTIRPWSAGTFAASNVFRKLENDWQKVYLAREDNDEPGMISWCLQAGPGLVFTSLCVRATTAVYNDGVIAWTASFDGGDPETADFGESPLRYERRFKTVKISASLSGGRGEVAWQHAQLFRLPAASEASAFHILASLTTSDKYEEITTAACMYGLKRNMS